MKYVKDKKRKIIYFDLIANFDDLYECIVDGDNRSYWSTTMRDMVLESCGTYGIEFSMPTQVLVWSSLSRTNRTIPKNVLEKSWNLTHKII